MPEQLQRRHVLARREIQADAGLHWVAVGALPLLADALDAGRSTEQQSHVRRTQDMAGHIAQRAAAEVIPAAPLERHVPCAEWTSVGDPQPAVPIERGRNGLR